VLISKKDLLKETGISYGQLYRWKREGLIPEEWFIKRPSFTGQETFFPKAKIIKRINAIKELKDQYSLEELAKMLSPEVAERMFTDKDLQIIAEIHPGLIPCFCKVFGKNKFSYIEVLFITAVSIFYKEHHLQLAEVEDICNGMMQNLQSLKQTDYLCLLLESNGTYFVVIQDEKANVYLDNRIKQLAKVRLNDISANMKIKYRKSFNFIFDEPEEDDVKENPLWKSNGEGVLV
jgi:hypothetical protein